MNNIIDFLNYTFTKKDFNSVIDFGCGGFPKSSSLSIPIKLGIEANPDKYFRAISQIPAVCMEMENIKHIIPFKHNIIDLGLFIDSLEHLDDYSIPPLLQYTCTICKTIFMFIPEGKVGYNPEKDKGYDLHKSFWSESKLKQFGFKTFLWENYHGITKNAILAYVGENEHLIDEAIKQITL